MNKRLMWKKYLFIVLQTTQEEGKNSNSDSSNTDEEDDMVATKHGNPEDIE